MFRDTHSPLCTMHFPPYFSSHRCFVTAAFVRLRLAYLAFSLTSPYSASGFFAKTHILPVKPNIHFLAVS